MTLIFPILLGGLALIAIPVVIHLILRQKPITLPFPAFRFLLKRHKTNLRKLRLRHLLLLALRMLVIAAICWALARPLLTTQTLGISSQRPVAAVLLFDTSLSMDYKTSEGVTRLEEAIKRGLEMLDQLPEGSRVAILDTAEAVLSSRGEWLLSSAQARDRIRDLKLRIDNAPVTRRLGQAYKLLAEVGRGREEGNISTWPRLLCVFSDRTRATWNAGDRETVLDNIDQAPPLFEGLMQAKTSLPALAELLKNLRTKLPPPPGRDYPDQSLLEAIAVLKDRLPGLTRDYLPPEPTLEKMINDVRRRSRDVISHVQTRPEEEAKEYSAKLITALETALRDLNGVQTLWIDVGIDQPADLALLALEFPPQPNGQPKQVFADNDIIIARAVVQATGMDFNSEITCQIGNKTYRRAVEVKAGSSQTVPFEIDAQSLKLAPGPHQFDVRLATPDALAFNNQRFATFAIREPRKVLILADNDKVAHYLLRAIDSLKLKSGFDGTVRFPDQVPKTDLRDYEVVFMLGLAGSAEQQWEQLWDQLKVYVEGGGGLAVIPGADDMEPKYYKIGPAQALLPGTFGNILAQKEGAIWNFEEEAIYQHPFMQPFQHWKEWDVVKTPRSAFYFWEVTPQKEGIVLVHYANDPKEKSATKRPALLERRLANGGKVVQFTTPMAPAPKSPWNNYLEDLTSSFYLIVTDFTMRYLAGETEAPNLNFIIGREPPRLAVPLTKQHRVYALRGPELNEQVPAGEQANLLVLKKLLPPGNYVVEGASTNKTERVGAFSVNAQTEESDLTRVAEADIEGVLGAGAVVGLDRKADIKTALAGHWSEPVELFSFLLVLLLLLLAVENLLANKFYRKEN